MRSTLTCTVLTLTIVTVCGTQTPVAVVSNPDTGERVISTDVVPVVIIGSVTALSTVEIVVSVVIAVAYAVVLDVTAMLRL